MRCKFKLESVTHRKEHSELHFEPVTTGSPENAEFFKWTPGGDLKLSVVKRETAEKLVPGAEYYLDITPAG
jgi:hypothetical protein